MSSRGTRHPFDNTVGMANWALCDVMYGCPQFTIAAAFSRAAREPFVQVKKTGWASDDKMNYAVERWLPPTGKIKD